MIKGSGFPESFCFFHSTNSRRWATFQPNLYPNMKPITFLISALAALPLSVSADCPGHQMEAAQKKAAEQKKDLLIVISGSTWSEGSKKLDQEVLKNEAFKKEIEKDFVNVIFDYPNRREDAHTDLLEIQQKYRFREMPSLILADQGGRPYAYTGSKNFKPEELIKHLAGLHKVGNECKRLFDEGSKAKGMERAKLYIKALKSLETLPEGMIREFYSPELTLIAQADPKGESGYVNEIEKAEALRKERERYNLFLRNREFDKVIKEAKAEGAKLKGEDAQRLKIYEIQALAGKHEYDQAMKEVEAMKKMAPESDYAKNTGQYSSYLSSAKVRHERMTEAAKNPKVKKPSKPIVSKPVAIVTDINELKKEAKAADVAAANAIAKEEELKKANAGTTKKIADLEAELKKLRENDKKAAEALKIAAAEREKLARKAKAMKEVVENHEAMEKRKRDIAELEKKAAALQKQAEDLRKKAAGIKTGK